MTQIQITKAPDPIDLIFLGATFLAGVWVLTNTRTYLKVFGIPSPSRTRIWIYRLLRIVVVSGTSFYLWQALRYYFLGK